MAPLETARGVFALRGEIREQQRITLSGAEMSEPWRPGRWSRDPHIDVGSSV